VADPFAVTPQAPTAPGPGFLGIPSSSWQNLANFGANMSVAANARDPNGFLTYGSGIAGPMGEAALQTEKQAQSTAQMIAQQQLIGAQAQGQQISNLKDTLQIPMLEAQVRFYTDPGPNGYAAIMGLSNPQQDPNAPQDTSGARAAQPAAPTADALQPYTAGSQASATGLTPNAPGTEGTNLIGDAVRGVESQGNYQATNKAGYVGAYQFGSANLQSAGLYKPAPGEDVSKNQWAGQITIPGYQPMSVAQFASPSGKAAQDAAWNIQQSNYWEQLQKNHLDSAIGMNIGGVQVTQPALIAGAHFAGVNGVMQWAATGGRYNPTDSNGTTLTSYMGQINQQVVQQQSLGGYNPQTQLNAQDQPGPMLAQGIPTPGKNLQMAQQYYTRASRVAMINPAMAAALQKQGDMYANMAEQATHPQDIRPGGLGVTAQGDVLKAGTPQMGFDQSGAAQLGNEQGSFSKNGISQGPATWEPTQVGAAGGPGGTPPPAPGPQMGSAAPPVQPVQGQPLAAPQAAPADYGSQLFDSALLGKPLPTPPAANGVYGQAPPGAEEVMKNGIERIDQQQEEAETAARGAVQANALLQQMRNEGQTWQSNNFAGWKNDARKWAMSIGQQFGISDPRLEQQVGDFATFNKNAQQLIQERVRQVSPRASTQEYNMIASAMPNAEIGNNGLTQITAELQGANDYQIAYNQAMSKWRGAQANMTPLQQYHATLGGFDGPFIAKVTPYAFMLNALGQTPDGQAQLHGMIQKLQTTPEGRAELQRLGSQIQYAQQAGLMNASGGGTGE